MAAEINQQRRRRPLSTHRAIQISELKYSLELNMSRCRICASNLARIGNRNGAIYYASRARKAQMILEYTVNPVIHNDEIARNINW